MAPTLCHDIEWNAGELGCGELVMELRMKMRAAPGAVFKVIAFDAGAPEDLPAWCRMTGHSLLHHDSVHCSFWIQARI
jgi:tRNA 2-thiouridine synthesizing protein A